MTGRHEMTGQVGNGDVVAACADTSGVGTFMPCVRAVLVSLFAILVAGSTGCLGRSPIVSHYMLGTAALGDPGAPGGVADSAVESVEGSNLAILVGPVRLPAYLDRPQIARLESGGAVELDEFERWLGGFEANFLRALSLGLTRDLGSIKIVSHPSKAPFPLDWQIRVHIDDLIVDAEKGELRVRIRWAKIAGESRSDAELFLFEKRLPVGIRNASGTFVSDDSTEAIVAVHDAAIDDLVREIVSQLRSD